MYHILLKRFEKILAWCGDCISSRPAFRAVDQAQLPEIFQSFADGFTRYVKFRFQIAQPLCKLAALSDQRTFFALDAFLRE